MEGESPTLRISFSLKQDFKTTKHTLNIFFTEAHRNIKNILKIQPYKILIIDKELTDIRQGISGLSDKYLLSSFKASVLFSKL